MLLLLYRSLLKGNLTDLMIYIIFEYVQYYKNFSKTRIKNYCVFLHPNFLQPNAFLPHSFLSSSFLVFFHFSFPTSQSLSHQIWNHKWNLVFHLISSISNSLLVCPSFSHFCIFNLSAEYIMRNTGLEEA